jgi:hypothetical protein
MLAYAYSFLDERERLVENRLQGDSYQWEKKILFL